jgi:toxin ParE1/3/4
VRRRRVFLAPEARDDLLGIYDAIAIAASPAVALSYVERLEAWCHGFDLASERGHARDDIKPGLRIAGFERRIVAAFTVDEDRITFLRLFRGGQNWARAFP